MDNTQREMKMTYESNALSELLQKGIEQLGFDHPNVLLADAALRYGSTSAHNARAQSAAFDALLPLVQE